MTAENYHAWLIAKLNHHATLDADLAYKAKQDGDERVHELLARSCREMRLVQMWVEGLPPSRAKSDSVSKS